MRRLDLFRRTLPVALVAVLTVALTACFGNGEDTEGPTTDTGGNTVVTLSQESTPVTPTTGVIQQPPIPPTSPPDTAATTGTTREPGAQLIYTINPGDTLYGIATQFGVTVDDLVALNNLEDPNSIQAGDQLFIPPPG